MGEQADQPADSGQFGAPPTIVLPVGALMVRVHHVSRGPIFFGPLPGSKPSNRFDAPNGEYRILYASERLEGAFVETILRRPKDRILRRAFVNERAWSGLRLVRSMVLAKFHDEGLQFYGTDAGELGAEDYAISRVLAMKIHAEYKSIDGIAYRSRYNNGEICYGIFDRIAVTDVTVTTPERFDQNDDTVDQLMRLYRASFDTSASVPEIEPSD